MNTLKNMLSRVFTLIVLLGLILMPTQPALSYFDYYTGGNWGSVNETEQNTWSQVNEIQNWSEVNGELTDNWSEINTNTSSDYSFTTYSTDSDWNEINESGWGEISETTSTSNTDSAWGEVSSTETNSDSNWGSFSTVSVDQNTDSGWGEVTSNFSQTNTSNQGNFSTVSTEQSTDSGWGEINTSVNNNNINITTDSPDYTWSEITDDGYSRYTYTDANDNVIDLTFGSNLNEQIQATIFGTDSPADSSTSSPQDGNLNLPGGSWSETTSQDTSSDGDLNSGFNDTSSENTSDNTTSDDGSTGTSQDGNLNNPWSDVNSTDGSTSSPQDGNLNSGFDNTSSDTSNDNNSQDGDLNMPAGSNWNQINQSDSTTGSDGDLNNPWGDVSSTDGSTSSSQDGDLNSGFNNIDSNDGNLNNPDSNWGNTSNETSTDGNLNSPWDSVNSSDDSSSSSDSNWGGGTSTDGSTSSPQDGDLNSPSNGNWSEVATTQDGTNPSTGSPDNNWGEVTGDANIGGGSTWGDVNQDSSSGSGSGSDSNWGEVNDDGSNSGSGSGDSGWNDVNNDGSGSSDSTWGEVNDDGSNNDDDDDDSDSDSNWGEVNDDGSDDDGNWSDVDDDDGNWSDVDDDDGNWNDVTDSNPPTINLLMPQNNGTVSSTTPELSWNASDPENDPLTFDIYLNSGTLPTQPTTVIASVERDQTYKLQDSQALTNNQTYVWMIIAKDGHGNEVNSEIRQFTVDTSNNAPSIVLGGVTGTNTTTPTVSWIGTDSDNDTLTYTVLFGTANNNLTVISPQPITGTAGQTQTFQIPATENLVDGNTYFWAVTVTDNKIATPLTSQTRSFTISLGSTPANQAPTLVLNELANNETNSLNPTLTWTATDPDNDPMTFDVYLNQGSAPDLSDTSQRIGTGLTAMSFDVPDNTLTYGNTYYWGVVAHDDHNNHRASTTSHFAVVSPGSYANIFAVEVVAKDRSGKATNTYKQADQIDFHMNITNLTGERQTIEFEDTQIYHLKVFNSTGQQMTHQTTSVIEEQKMIFEPNQTIPVVITWNQKIDVANTYIYEGTYTVKTNITPTTPATSQMPQPADVVLTIDRNPSLTKAGKSHSASGGGGGGGGSGGGYTPDITTVYKLPDRMSDKELRIFRPISFEVTNGNIPMPLVHINFYNKLLAKFKRKSSVSQNGKPFTGILQPPFKISYDKLAGIPLPDRKILDPYLIQYGDLTLDVNPNYELIIPINPKILDKLDNKANYKVLGWNFHTKKWDVVGDSSNVNGKELKLSLSHSTVIAQVDISKKATYKTTASMATESDSKPRTESFASRLANMNLNEIPGYALFKDAQGHWATRYINILKTAGIIEGYQDDTFRPNSAVTRAELTKMILELYNVDVKNASKTSFPDVDSRLWYAPYISKAKEFGVVHGYNDGTFKPNQPINRAEALKIIFRVNKNISEGELNAPYNAHKAKSHWYADFRDVLMNTWYAKYVSFGKAKGIIQGYQDGLFHGERSITRAEVAKILVVSDLNTR